MKIAKTIGFILALSLFLPACGIKVKEPEAQAVMRAIFKARKSGNVDRELRYYAKKEFNIVPYSVIEEKVQNLNGHTGNLQKVTLLKTRIENRNELGKGLMKYMILSYNVKYSRMTLTESYYFLGSSAKPKLVYVSFQ